MKAFGVRFQIDDPERFANLQSLFDALKKDKDAGVFRDPEAWKPIVPDHIKSKFHWPSSEARALRLTRRPPIVVAEPYDQLGTVWDFYSVFESVKEAEYMLLECSLIDTKTAEIRIEPSAYPYGGVGPFIAMVEAYGFRVLGVNECGKYQSREELAAPNSESMKIRRKPWWKYW